MAPTMGPPEVPIGRQWLLEVHGNHHEDAGIHSDNRIHDGHCGAARSLERPPQGPQEVHRNLTMVAKRSWRPLRGRWKFLATDGGCQTLATTARLPKVHGGRYGAAKHSRWPPNVHGGHCEAVKSSQQPP
jgi:hypothetical protein